MVSASFKESENDILNQQREVLKASKKRSEALYKKAEELGFDSRKKPSNNEKKKTDK
ncbi:hypothetical protein [Salinicoccus sp. YB14-2]|uniref:hypothetical protein n=1 Tax=Salinicoccus sp. YB14-2 TaxID=1572701 RepID=UPI000A604589|nr:hypothetical protein [Salinicoccus sp. YB14-2]